MNKAIVRNIGWLAFDRLVRLSLGFLIIIWLARYLGPEAFGWFSYAQALVLLVGAMATLGLNNIVVRELVNEPDRAFSTMGSAFLLNLISGVLGYLLAIVAVFFLQDADSPIRLLVAILGLTLICKSSHVVKYWFEAQVESRQVVKVEVPIALVIIALNAVMILLEAPVTIFIALVTIESVVVGIFLAFRFRSNWGPLNRLSFSAEHMLNLLKQSWPLCLAGIAVLVYMRIDQIMIGQMLGAEHVGFYTAAVMISEVWYVFPTIIAASVFPALLKGRANLETADPAMTTAYNRQVQQLLDWMVVAAVSLALGAMIFANPVVDWLYGREYAASSSVLQVHIWAAVFVFIGVIGTKWMLAEGLEKLVFYRTVIGAVVNVILNLALIPRYGIEGAAAATLISQGLAAFGLDALHPATRPLFLKKCSACCVGPARVVAGSLRRIRVVGASE